MSRIGEVIVGLNAGSFEARAAAFQPDGREIACAAVAHAVVRTGDAGLECDPGEAWQTSARAMRRLAEQVPGLAGRTVALAITGPSGGIWPVDEDGDPLGPACLWLDARARGLVQSWWRSGIAREVEALTGSTLTPAMPSAQLAWLQRHRGAALEQAAAVLGTKDWLYSCCTGERAVDPADAVASFGNLATGRYDGHVLDRLGLLDLEPILPDVRAGARHAGRLDAAPAVAMGLREGTPVVPAPSDRLAAALSLGLDAPGNGVGGTLLEPLAVHMRIAREPAPIDAGEGLVTSIMPFPSGGFSRAVVAAEGTLCVDWLVGMCEELLVDAGLIGFPRAELVDLLERKAALANARGPSFQMVLDDGAALPVHPPGARLERLSGEDSLYAILRAVHTRIGQSARIGHAALGGGLSELRVAGEGARSALCRSLLGACVGAPVRQLHRSDAAAAGAARFAAFVFGHHRDAASSRDAWVLPHLGASEPVDRGLTALYDERVPVRRQDEVVPHRV